MGVGDRVRLVGWVGDDDLPALYAGALCFVYPSEYEGFGLQLCEAMAVGCPVLAAAATSLPEVLGMGGETFDLDSPEMLAGLLQRVISEPDFRADLSRRARLRSADFSWRRTADATAAVYRELVPQTQRGPTSRQVRRSLLNFATSGLLMAVTMVVSLKATPYLTRWLGNDRYGGYTVVNQAYG